MRHLPWLVTGLTCTLAAPSIAAGAPQATALYSACRAVGPIADGGYQFIVTCAGRSRSPDGRFAIVQRAYRDEQPPVELQDPRGRRLSAVSALRDDMPFQLFWSPDSHWFFVNHHVGSFMDRLRIFEIVGARAMERPALTDAAARVATVRYSCLRAQAVQPNGVRWTPDGRRIVLVTISRPDACAGAGRSGVGWRPLWMIGDPHTGRIAPGSVRVDRHETGLREPRDGLYRRTRRSRLNGSSARVGPIKGR